MPLITSALEDYLMDLVVYDLYLVLLALTEQHVHVLSLTPEVRIVDTEIAEQFFLSWLYSDLRVTINQEISVVNHSQHRFCIFPIFLGVVLYGIESERSKIREWEDKCLTIHGYFFSITIRIESSQEIPINSLENSDKIMMIINSLVKIDFMFKFKFV